MSSEICRYAYQGMFLLGLCAAAVSMAGCNTTAGQARSLGLIDDNGFTMIDGQPRLIIGLYETPADDAVLHQLADSGFNLLKCSADKAALQRIHDHGMYAWISLGNALNLPENSDSHRQSLAKTVNSVKDHPGLLVWELPDEALWNIFWRRREWVLFQQRESLEKIIAEAEEKSTPQQIEQWQQALAKADDHIQRGLYGQGEKLFDALWKALGSANPRPNVKLSTYEQDATSMAEGLTRGCRLVRSLDRRHLIWHNHAPRNTTAALRMFNQGVDVAGCDIYPVPTDMGIGHSDIADKTLTSVGAYTDRMQRGAPGKPVWMILQGFGWEDIGGQAGARRPNYNESRFMAYNAILHDAKAIVYFGTTQVEKDSTFWADLMRIGKEISALQEGIVGAKPQQPPISVSGFSYGSVDEQGPRLMLRRTGDDWVLIAGNEYGNGISFEVKDLPAALNGKTFYRLYSDEAKQIVDGAFRDGIVGYGVNVYATSRRFEAK